MADYDWLVTWDRQQGAIEPDALAAISAAVGGGGGGIDTEAVQDVVGAMVAAAGGTYNDAAGTITLPSGGGSGGTIVADDTPAAPAEGLSASYLVTSAVSWPAGLVWSTDPDGDVAPTITGSALVSLFTVGGTTRAIMGATFPAPPAPADTTAPTWTATFTMDTPTSSAVVATASALASDNSGSVTYEVSYDNAATWAAIVPSGSNFTLAGTAGTTYATTKLRAKDAAGNTSTPVLSVPSYTMAASADVTNPTVGTMAASAITSSGFVLTVSGASDETALHATPYAFTTDNGATWTAYQASAAYTASGLAASTGYSCNWRVKDAAGNVSTGTAQTVTTTTPSDPGVPVGPYVWEREVASSSESPNSSTSVPLTVAGTSGRVLVAALSADKNAGTISVSGGWTIGAQYIGNSVSGAIAYRLATGTDDITWTLGTAQVAMTTVHEWSGFAGAPTLQDSAFAPDPVDDTTRSTITIDGGAASAQALAVVTAGQDTADGALIAGTTVSGGYTFRKMMRAGSGGVSLLFAEQEVDASDATAATFDFNDHDDQSYALTILLRG